MYLFNLWRCFFIANSKDDLLTNERIRASELIVIGPNGEQLGTKKLADALTLASYAGLDLVLINSSGVPPVAKVMDYNRFRYEKQKKTKEQQKKQRESNKPIKEYQLTVAIDVHDFETRRRNAQEYLIKGHKIKASLFFKGRQLAHPELGKEVLERFADALSETSVIESVPKMEGKKMFMLLAPKK